MNDEQVEQELPFEPFYEWLPHRFPIPFIVKVLLAVILGFLFLIPRYLVVGEAIITDWSWLLCLIIITALVCLYYATHTFRAMFQQLNHRLPAGEETFPARLEHLGNVEFLLGGIVFGLLNCLVGRILGVPGDGVWDAATMYLGFFLAGFACGMPVSGIRGVVITLTHYLDRSPHVDYTNPDGCGGLLFLGQALIKFSAVTLVVGVLIAIFILEAGWSKDAGGFPDLVRAAMWLWIAIPFLLSLTILLAPASRANRVLMNHKIQTEVALALSLRATRVTLKKQTTEGPPQERSNKQNAIEESASQEGEHQQSANSERRDALRQELEHVEKHRLQLHQMRTWPLNAQANISFVVLFVTNAIVAFESIRGLIAGPDN